MSLKHAILVLLETEPGSGYDLLQHFKGRLGYFWNAKHQQIYQQLKKLNQEGLITFQVETQESKPDKKVYAITPEGEQELRSWLSGQVAPAKVNDALLIQIYGGHLTDNAHLLKELARHRSLHEKTLSYLQEVEKSYLELNEEGKQKYKLPYLTLRRGILGEQAWLKWAEEALKEIKK